MIQIIVILLMIILMLVGVAVNDWTLLLIIPIGLLNAWINSKAIQKHLVGRLWHNLQLFILLVTLGTLVWVKIIMWDEILLLMALYYATFEVTLNLFRKKPYNYVGKTSFMDRMIWKVFKTQASVNTFFSLGKLLLIFAGVAIYLTGKPM